MNYIVKPLLPKKKKEIEITENNFLEITDALKLAWDIVSVKELFSYVVRNYCLLEDEIKRIEDNDKNDPDNCDQKISAGSFSRENTHTFNLLLSNLLSACRSYLEIYDYQRKNEHRSIFINKNDIRKQLEQAKTDYHDQDFLCIFFWALRNYAQHDSSPITGSPFGRDYGILSIDYSINPKEILKKITQEQLKKAEISNVDEAFEDYLKQKQNCLSAQELSNYPYKLNLRQLTKDYIILLNTLQEKTNNFLSPKLKEAKEILTKNVEYYCKNSSPNSGFQICKIGKAKDDLNECFDVQVRLINQWEETIKQYGNIHINDII